MRIRKAFQGTIPPNKILDTYSTSKTDTYSCNISNKLKKEGSTYFKTLGDGVYETLIASVDLQYAYSRECLIVAIGMSGHTDTTDTGIAILCPSCSDVTTNQMCPITCMGNLTSSMFRIESVGTTMNIYYIKNVHYRREYIFCLGKSDSVYLNT